MAVKDRTVLVTGASGGIGRQMARRFHEMGNRVVVASRNVDALRETIGDRDAMTAIELDVSDREAVGAFVRDLVTNHSGIDVLVNNAGIMRAEDLTSDGLQTQDATEIVTTNLLGTIWMTHELLPHLRRKEKALIFNVSSGLGFVPLVATPAYSATKAAIHSWTLSLREQLMASNVDVHEIIPPKVATELMPGQSEAEDSLPLDHFIEEIFEQIGREEIPWEIYPERTAFLRNAEKEHRFGEVFKTLNPPKH